MSELARDAASILLPIGTVVIGFFLALRQYRIQRRWDARHSAYQEILGDVCAIRRWANENYANEKCLPSVSIDQLVQLSKQFELARARLWQHVDVGELTISQDSVTALRGLMEEIEEERFNFEQEGIDDSNRAEVVSAHCEKIRSVIEKSLPSLLKLAKNDLK
jgi:hypothetical protein